jgi:hypothetical protein
MNPNILHFILSQQQQREQQMKPIIEMVEIAPNVFAKLGTKMTTETPVTTAVETSTMSETVSGEKS